MSGKAKAEDFEEPTKGGGKGSKSAVNGNDAPERFNFERVLGHLRRSISLSRGNPAIVTRSETKFSMQFESPSVTELVIQHRDSDRTRRSLVIGSALIAGTRGCRVIGAAV
jgi:hypothetical protein